MDFMLIKAVHVTAVALSGAGFLARGLGSLAGAAWVRGRVAKSLPHLVDTILLVSALWLAWTLQLSPTAAPWLGAKIAGLVVYIGLGVVALRPTMAPAMRGAAWACALLTFAWIVSVAISKQPLGLLAADLPASVRAVTAARATGSEAQGAPQRASDAALTQQVTGRQ